MSIVIDNYSESNLTGAYIASSSLFRGQSFTGKHLTLESIKVFGVKYGTPTGNVVLRVYSHSGAYGSSSVGNVLLATSDPVSVSTFRASYTPITFTFSGDEKIAMEDGTNYVWMIEPESGGWPNCIAIGGDATSPTHNGNSVGYSTDDQWTSGTGLDYSFYVYGIKGAYPLPAFRRPT